MIYLSKAHHHDATPIKYSEIAEGDTIARPIKDTYTVGVAHHKTQRKWFTEAGEIIAAPQHRKLVRLNRNTPPPNPATDPLIIAYRITAGPDSETFTNQNGWHLRLTDAGYSPVDGEPLHGEDYFLPEEIHDWAPAHITIKD